MNSIIDLVGNTPLVDISKLFNKSKVKLYAKLEGNNPAGSVKDRAALNMITEGLKEGTFSKDSKLIEATSGNTGIALAMIAAHFGLNITLVMTDNSTPERVKTMLAYGAKVTLTPAELTIEYARTFAEKKVKEEGYVMLNQFGNKHNYLAHYKSTGPEIWKDTNQKITHFVSSMGTTGTIMGVSKFLKEQNSLIQIIGVQPKYGSRIPGIRRWSPGFLPVIFDDSRVDRKMDVSREESVVMARRLASEVAVFGGMSSGGATAAAIKLAQELDDAVIVCIICDRGDRYLSTDLFV